MVTDVMALPGQRSAFDQIVQNAGALVGGVSKGITAGLSRPQVKELHEAVPVGLETQIVDFQRVFWRELKKAGMTTLVQKIQDAPDIASVLPEINELSSLAKRVLQLPNVSSSIEATKQQIIDLKAKYGGQFPPKIEQMITNIRAPEITLANTGIIEGLIVTGILLPVIRDVIKEIPPRMSPPPPPRPKPSK